MQKLLQNIIESIPKTFIISIMIVISIWGILSGKIDIDNKKDIFTLAIFIIGLIGLTFYVLREVKQQVNKGK